MICLAWSHESADREVLRRWDHARQVDKATKQVTTTIRVHVFGRSTSY